MYEGFSFHNIEIKKKIAQGGMGEIFLATQRLSEFFERDVVVKNIRHDFTEDQLFVEMFFQEARITAKLLHENIVQIYDLNKIGDQYYILMEYIDGENLLYIGKSAFEQREMIPVPLIVRIIEQACNGLWYAHRFTDATGDLYNIVHRDISLQNIMVTYSGVVKVLDFGVMQTSHESLDMLAKVPGKINYMSPEILLTGDADARSDLFSLGIVFYQMLTGKKPFRQKNIELLKEQIIHEKPLPPSDFIDLPPEIDRIVMKLLEKKPERRYQSTRELQDELERYLFDNGERVSARTLSEYLHHLFPRVL